MICWDERVILRLGGQPVHSPARKCPYKAYQAWSDRSRSSARITSLPADSQLTGNRNMAADALPVLSCLRCADEILIPIDHLTLAPSVWECPECKTRYRYDYQAKQLEIDG